MSFTVPCPHCSAPIRIRDEFAGRPMKCPKCEGVVPKSATVRPDDDEDDTPAPVKPKAKPAAVKPRPADEEDDRPRSRRRADDEDEDEEDDRPRRRSRRDDEDDQPRKKKNVLPLVLGGLGAVFLLCGGGCAGVWFFGIKPAADRVKAKNDEFQREIEEAMRKDLEAMSKGGPANTPATAPLPVPTGIPVATLTPDEVSQNADMYKGKWVTVRGKVQSGMEVSADWAAITLEQRGGVKPLMFAGPKGLGRPKTVLFARGDEVEILCQVDGLDQFGSYVNLSNAQVTKRTPKAEVAPPKPPAPNTPPTAARPAPVPVRPTPPADEKPIEITAVDLLAEYAKDQKAADAKYKEKVLKVTGEVKRAAVGAVNLVGKPEGGWTLQITAPVPREDRAAVGNLKAGEQVTLTGKVALFTTNNTTKTAILLLRDVKLVK